MHLRDGLVVLPLLVGLGAVWLPCVEIAGEAILGVDRTPLGAALWAPAGFPVVVWGATRRRWTGRRGLGLLLVAVAAAAVVAVGILGHFQLGFSLLPIRYLPAVWLLVAAQVVGLGSGLVMGVWWAYGPPPPPPGRV